MSEQEEVLRRLAKNAATIRRFNRIKTFEPYLKQAEFFANGALTDERAFIAANQVGKTITGSYEDAVHATGEYPTEWKGHRFNHPVTGWIAGPIAEKVRDSTQEMLFGPWNRPDEFGTGFIPREAIVGRPSLSRGITGAYDTATIKWRDKNGRLDDSALSTITFKAYTEEQLAFASSTIDFYHGDEESKQGIYTESRVRLQVKKGISYVTLTPLLGRTDFILWFETHGMLTQMGIYDAVIGHDPERPYLGHYTKEDADKKVAGLPVHERDARAYGVPMLGEGKVFLTDENEYKIERPLDVPAHWRKLWGVDFGGPGSGAHPFAAVLVAIDVDYDIVYLLHVLKLKGMTRLQHIAKMRQIAPSVRVVWPHDGNEMREGGSGTVSLAQQYREPLPGMPGLLMHPTHATWPQGGFATSTAVDELDTRMSTGRFKAVDTCADFWHEVRLYHRKNHQFERVNDDVLSALFKTLMMKRYARAGALDTVKEKYAPKSAVSQQPERLIPDINPFTGDPIDR